MFCKRCGAQLKESAAFCPKCGTKIVKNTLPTTEQILSNVDNLPDTEPEVKSEIRETDFAESTTIQ